MKKNSSNKRKAIILLAFTAMMTSFDVTARAGDLRGADNEHRADGLSGKPRNHKQTGSASTSEVKYLGGQDGELLVNVLYDNTTGSKFTIGVFDEEGNRIFFSAYTDKNFDKKYRVVNAENYGKLVFVIQSYADNSEQRFEINSNPRMIETIEVREIK